MKQRICMIQVNLGPDGTDAVFDINALTISGKMRVQNQALVPLSDYEVSIGGWTHWTEMR